MDIYTVLFLLPIALVAGLLGRLYITELMDDARRYRVVEVTELSFAVVDVERANMVVGTFSDEDTAEMVAARLETL
jgi:hypothetical protein